MAALPDIDPSETEEWLEALDGVLEHEGPQRAHFILERLIDRADVLIEDEMAKIEAKSIRKLPKHKNGLGIHLMRNNSDLPIPG